jgi:alpha-tubulin suppressor-like RCC1 family protein
MHATPPLIATSVTAGVELSCAVLDDGTPRCWGDLESGSVGIHIGSTVALIPVRNVRQMALTSRACAPAKITAISLGSQLCAILADGSVACSDTQARTLARLVPLPDIKDAISISAGSNGRSCAVTRSGKVDCWGRLAPPPVINEDEGSIWRDATRIAGVDRAIAVAAGRVQDCALLGTGKVSCWSYSKESRAQPSQTLPLEHISALSSGNSLTCALTDTGEVYCGNDPYTVSHGNATAITQVSGLKDATMFSVGANHACALTHGGSVRCWGRNVAAQLGSLYDLMQPGLPADGGMTAHVVFGFADDAAH